MDPNLELRPCFSPLPVPLPLPAVPGSYYPIHDLNAMNVQYIAEFAISEHNKEAKADLQFTGVVSGVMQVVAGVNYCLIISAVDGKSGASGKYAAFVYEPIDNRRHPKLTSFKSV